MSPVARTRDNTLSTDDRMSCLGNFVTRTRPLCTPTENNLKRLHFPTRTSLDLPPELEKKTSDHLCYLLCRTMSAVSLSQQCTDGWLTSSTFSSWRDFPPSLLGGTTFHTVPSKQMKAPTMFTFRNLSHVVPAGTRTRPRYQTWDCACRSSTTKEASTKTPQESYTIGRCCF